MLEIGALVVAAAAFIGAFFTWSNARQLKRAEFIRAYRWPRGLLNKLSEKHPALTRKDTALASRGLRQFFLAHLMSGNKICVDAVPGHR